MKRHLLIFFLLLLGKSLVYSQPYTLWMKKYGDDSFQIFESLWQTSDGNIVAVGKTERPFGFNNWDVWVVKTDAWGDTLWTKKIGNVWDRFDSGTAIQETADSGFVIVGHIAFPWGDIDAWLIKLDSEGNILWDRTYTDDDEFTQSGRDLDITQDGGYIIVTTDRDSLLNRRALVIRTDSIGDTLWTLLLGGAERDDLDSVQETVDGGYILTGDTRSFNYDSTSFQKLWLVRLDEDGQLLWMRTYFHGTISAGFSVSQTTDSGFIISGNTEKINDSGDFDGWLLKTDSNGDTLWTRTYGGTGHEIAYSVLQTEDGGYIFAGSSDSPPASPFKDVWIVRTDSLGDTLWTKTLGDTLEERGREIIDFSGGFVVAGHMAVASGIFPQTQFVKGLLIRIGEALSRLAVGRAEGTIDDLLSVPVRVTFPLELTFTSIHLEISGYQNNLSFIGLDTVNTVIGKAGWISSVIETDDGIAIAVSGIEPLTADDTLFNLLFEADLFVEEFINIIIDSAIIDTGKVPVELKNGGVQLIPIVGVGDDNSSLPDRYYLGQNYPNPFNPVTTIKFDLPAGGHSTLIIYNILGQEVIRLVDEFLEQGRYAYNWDASGKTSGLYIYKLTSGNFVQSRKMVLLK